MKKYPAQIIFFLALVLLFFMDASESATSLCIFKFIGLASCFGCGIGHAIHYALHFNFSESYSQHIAGIPATLVILYTIIKPFFPSKNLAIWTNNKCL